MPTQGLQPWQKTVGAIGIIILVLIGVVVYLQHPPTIVNGGGPSNCSPTVTTSYGYLCNGLTIPCAHDFYKDGPYFARNCHTNIIDFSGTNPATVINNAIVMDKNATQAGAVEFFENAEYDFSTTSTTNDGVISGAVVMYCGIHLRGESRNGVVFKWTGSVSLSSPIIINWHRTTTASSTQCTQTDQDMSVESMTLNLNQGTIGIGIYSVNQVPGTYNSAPYWYTVRDVQMLGSKGTFISVGNVVNFNYNIQVLDSSFIGSGSIGGDAIGGGTVINYVFERNYFENTNNVVIDASSFYRLSHNYFRFSALAVAGGPANIPLFGGFNNGFGVNPQLGGALGRIENNLFVPKATADTGGVALFISQTENGQGPAPLVVEGNTFVRDVGDGNNSTGIAVGFSQWFSPNTPIEATIISNYFYNLRGVGATGSKTQGAIWIGRFVLIKKLLITDNTFRDDNSPITMTGIVVTNATGLTGMTISYNDLKSTETPIRLAVTLPVGNMITNNVGYNPVAINSVTAGASPWTFTNNDYWNEFVMLYTVGGISALTCDGVTGWAITAGTECFLAPTHSMVVTWATTAPVFQKQPQ